MTDIFSPEKRSELMSRIRSRDTRPERQLRSLLHRMGYRFRLHVAKLPGKPDIVLPRHRTVIFLHGCFWHQHPGCRYACVPKSRTNFWDRKFAANRARDEQVENELERLGWQIIIVWECELRKLEEVAVRLSALISK